MEIPCKMCEVAHELAVLKTKRYEYLVQIDREIILKEEELNREMITTIKEK